ncbi:MAG: OsmC family protein [Anaerolineae bacterium]|nr:OsmC family protein [Anaerolineae bacterium]
MVLTMAAVADYKGITYTRLAATVEGRTEFVGRETRTRFVSHLDIGEGLTAREQRILYNAARTCEVHKMLRGEIEFSEHLEGLRH